MNAPIYTGLALSDKTDPAFVLQTISEGIDAARITGEPDWVGATDALIDACITLNACFTSGEIAAWIRTYRPDVRFSVTQNIGPHIRTRFTNNTLPDYTSGPVEQQSRQTAGYSRAPVHTTVYVYGPDSFAISTHRFEVEVPAPGGVMPDLTDLPAMPVQSATPIQPVFTSRPARRAVGRRVLPFSGTPTATVHTDSRLCIPRRAFEALASRQQRTVSGGDDVFVATAGDEIVISLDPVPGARKFSLVTSRCRLLFTAATAAPFAVGSHYTVAITDHGLKLDMSSPL